MRPFLRRFVLQASLALAAASCSAGSNDSSGDLPADSAHRAWSSLAASSATEPRIEWDARSGTALELAGSFPLRGKDVSEAVPSFLRDHAALFGVAAEDLRLTSLRESLVGWHLRYEQRAAGRKVHGTELAVHVERGRDAMRVFLVRSAIAPHLVPAASTTTDAVASTRAQALATSINGVVEQIEPVVLPDGRAAREIEIRSEGPARRVRMTVADDGTLVDTQELLKTADGTGWVFDPSPVASTGDFTLADQANADSATLTASRVQVTLQGLDGTGKLSGPHVNAFNALNARAVVPSLAYDYTRSNDFFEEVMAYYHIDRAARRLHSLGFTGVMDWPIDVQVNGKAQDNSWYDTKKNMIMYGSGGVDDAEDADVILHEYGHVILWDQVPGFGSGYQAGAMDEGFADFHAVMAHSLGPAIKTDPACVAPWDATSYSPPPCLRRTDLTRHFPEHFQYDSHEDGQMWSSALYEASQTMGASETLRLVVEANFLLAPNATFQQASDAVRQTEQAIHAGANSELLRKLFTWRGMNRTITPPFSSAGAWESHSASLASPHPYPNLHDKWFEIHHAGATAIRVHFSQFSVEQGYDNVYLYDPAIHLYAVYTGALGAFTSVAIPGDTVRIRLVSDSQVTDNGYAIDSYEIPSSPPVDAGVPDSPPEASTPDVIVLDDAAPDVVILEDATPDVLIDDAAPDVELVDAGPEASQEDAAPDATSEAAASEDAGGDVAITEDGPSTQDGSSPEAAAEDSAAVDAASEGGPSADASHEDGSSPLHDAGEAGPKPKDGGSDAGIDGSAMTGEESSADSGGCGCRVADSGPGAPRALSALVLAGLLFVSRRRRGEARRAVLR